MSSSDSSTVNNEEKVPAASIAQVFKYATARDFVFIVLGSLGAIITGVSLPFMQLLFGRIMDALNGNPTNSDYQKQVNGLCIAFVSVGAINIVTGFLQVGCWTYVGERQTQIFREQYVRAILSQEIGWFDIGGASELSTKVADNTGKVQQGIGRKLGDVIQLLSQVVGSFVVAFYLCWKLTIILLAAFPAIVISAGYMINAITAATTKSLEQYAAAGGLATESLNAIRTVTALNMQPDVVSRYRVFLFEAMQVGIRKGFDVGVGNGALFCSCFLTYALGFWYGTYLLAESENNGCSGSDCLTGGNVLATFFSVLLGSMALGQLAPPAIAFTEALTALGKMLQVMNRKPLIDGLSQDGLQPVNKSNGEVSLNDVVFAYPSRPNIKVCAGYNLTIKAGETVALVGASGCGKSTIINLLLRFYDPQKGAVLLDGCDIKSLNIRWLRSQIGFVGQEPVLFAGTIGDNIAYGLDPALVSSKDPRVQQELREKIIAAAKLANAHDFISEFPEGYDTDVGSNGAAMSGGQKQRIAIARALIKKPAVLLLDEATSALDATSEKIVQQSIDRLQQMKSQTTIVIAHRLSTIRNADRICYIQQGQIMEIGTHDDLIKKENGLYADLVRLQMDQEEDGNLSEGVNSTTVALQSKQEAKNPVMHAAQSQLSLAKETSVVSEVRKENDKQKPKMSKEESKKISSEIWARVFRHYGWLITAVLGGMGFGAIFPVWGLLLAHSQNTLYLTDTNQMKEEAAVLAYYYIALAFAALISSTFEFWGTAQVGERVSCRIRSELFESLLRRDISFFDREENSIGRLTTLLADDSRTVNKAFGDTLARLMEGFFTILVGAALALSASWQIALVVLATFPINIAASIVQVSAMVQLQDQEDEGEQKAPSLQARVNESDAVVTAAQAAGAKTLVRVDSTHSDNGINLDDVYRGIAKSTASSKSSNYAKIEGNSTNDVAAPTRNRGIVSGNHSAVLSSAFTNMRTVCAFSMQHKVADHYVSITERKANLRMGKSPMSGLAFGFGQATQFFIYALLFWYGAKLLVEGHVTFVEMETAIFTLMLGALGLGIAFADLGDQQEGLHVAKRVFKSIEEGGQSPIDGLSIAGLQGNSTSSTSTRTTGRIELRDVFFRYPCRPDVEVCKRFNLVIEPGQMVALVGPSGSGKSTIVSLLLRFYDPESGSILLDGQDIRGLNTRWLRSQIGFVGQEPVLFSGSVSDNVKKGRADMVCTPLLSLEEAMKLSDAHRREQNEQEGSCCFCCGGKSSSDGDGDEQHVNFAAKLSHKKKTFSSELTTPLIDAESGKCPRISGGVNSDVLDACIASNAHDFIVKFPQGYDTDVGQGSIMVSGGQKQRIAIARALIKKPAVLLLDEATSALDAASEKIVQQSIDALQQMKAQTTIVIAHRLSTIRNADRIIVVNKGLIVETGTHEELLLNKEGLYSELWEKQNKAQPAIHSGN